MRFNCEQNLSASAAVNQSGATIDANQLLYCSLQAVVTGTSTGNLNFQVSNDPPVGLSANTSGSKIPVNWSNVTGATVAIAGAGVYLIPTQLLSYRWIRASFVATNAATGTIVVNIETVGP